MFEDNVLGAAQEDPSLIPDASAQRLVTTFRPTSAALTALRQPSAPLDVTLVPRLPYPTDEAVAQSGHTVAEKVAGLFSTIKTFGGHSYNVMTSMAASAALSGIAQEWTFSHPIASGTAYGGVPLPAPGIYVTGTSSPGAGSSLGWIHARVAEGYGIILSNAETFPLMPPPAQGIEGFIVATRDVRVAEALTMLGPESAFVLSEPSGGWETNGNGIAKVGFDPKYILYAGIGVVVIGGIAFFATRKR